MNVENIGRSRAGVHSDVMTDDSAQNIDGLHDDLQACTDADVLLATVPKPDKAEQALTPLDAAMSQLVGHTRHVVLPDDLDQAVNIILQRYTVDEAAEIARKLLRSMQNQANLR